MIETVQFRIKVDSISNLPQQPQRLHDVSANHSLAHYCCCCCYCCCWNSCFDDYFSSFVAVDKDDENSVVGVVAAVDMDEEDASVVIGGDDRIVMLSTLSMWDMVLFLWMTHYRCYCCCCCLHHYWILEDSYCWIVALACLWIKFFCYRCFDRLQLSLSHWSLCHDHYQLDDDCND